MLLSGIDRPSAVFVLDADRDGLRQIAADLAGMNDLRAIHLVTHGEEGELRLGNIVLSQGNIESYAPQFQAIRASLAPGADLLVYGCDVAAGSDGQAFVDALAAKTGANVAASTNVTGVGGDWKLETETGPIEAKLPFAASTLTEYQGTLAMVPGVVSFHATEGIPFIGQVTTFTDSTPSSSYSATIYWGDGSNSLGTVVAVSPGNYAVSGEHSYGDEGAYYPRVDIVNAGGTHCLAVTANSWNAVADLLTPRYELAAASVNGKIYALGGWGATFLSSMEVYNPATDAWTPSVNLPTPCTELGAVGSNGLIYAAGGYNATPDALNAFNPATQTWSSLANMPTPRYALAVVAGIDGRIYAIGGYDTVSGKVSNAFEVYDPATQKWTPLPNLPTARWYLGAATGPDGRIYAIGGHTGSDYTATVDVYDPSRNAWTPGASLPTARGGLAAVTGPDGLIYAISGSYSNEVDAYDPTTNTWTQVSALATGRWGLAATTDTNGHIFAIAGISGVGNNPVERFTVTPITVADADLTGSDLATATGGVEGLTPATLGNATFTDANPGDHHTDFTVSVDWGDGTPADPSATVVYNPTTLQHEVNGSHLYTRNGSYFPTINVNDVGGSTAIITGSATVADAPLTAKLESFSPKEGDWFLGPVATFTDANPFSMPGDFTANINWGDGSSDYGTVKGLDGTYTVSCGHQYQVEGRYFVTVTIKDNNTGAPLVVAHGVLPWKTDVVPLPAAQTGLQTVTAENGRIYAMTGSSMFVYDPVKNTWSQLADTPIAVEHFAAMQGSDGRIYLVNADPVDLGAGLVHTVQAFDPQTGVWQTCAALPSDAIGELALATSGGGLYALANATMYEYTPWSDSWSEVGDPGTVLGQLQAVTPQRGQVWDLLAAELGLPTLRTGFTVIVGADGRLYTIGGHTTSDGVLSGVVEAYDPGSATWTQLAGMPTPRDEFVAVLGPDGCIYTIGGDTGVVEAYDPVTNVWWTPSDPMPAPRHDFAAALGTNGSIYLLGGSYGTGAPLATVDALLPPIIVNEAGLTNLNGENVSAVEGERFTQTVAYFQDPAGRLDPLMDHYQATIDWGDGRTSVGTISDSGWSLTVEGTHRYNQSGSYTITTNITHHSYIADPVTSTATVSEADPTHVKGVNVSAAVGERLTNVPVATFRDPTGPDYPISEHYQAVISSTDGGDWTNIQITYDEVTGKFTVTGNHRYTSADNYYINTTIIHDEIEVSATSQAFVSSMNRVRGVDVSAVEGVRFTDAPVATFRADGGDYRARIDWGDGESSMGSVSNEDGRFVVIGSHRYAQEGSYTVTTRITDLNVGYRTEATSVATVAGMVPGVVRFEATEGTPFSGRVTTFTDANPHSRREDFTATINWGDGSSSAGTIGQRVNGTFTVSGEHKYVEEGPYFVTVQITDRGGATIVARGAVAWSSAPSMLAPREMPQVLVGPDGRIYAIGGYDSTSGSWSNALESYMPGDPSWMALASVPEPREDFVAVMGADGRIYVMGGWDPDRNTGELSRTVQVYDPDVNKWTTQKKEMKEAREDFVAVVDANGFIYALGGWDVNGNLTNTLQIYNPDLKKWTIEKPMPRTRQDFGEQGSGLEQPHHLELLVGPDGLIYVLGGLDPNNNLPTNTVQVYDPATGSWHIENPMPRARDLFTAVVGPDGRIYAIGGYDANRDLTQTLQAYDPATHTWSVLPHMPTARVYAGVTVGTDDPRIFVIGGYDGSGEVATVEAYDPASQRWSTLPPLSTPRYFLGTVPGTDGRIYAVGGSASGIPGMDVVEALAATPIMVRERALTKVTGVPVTAVVGEAFVDVPVATFRDPAGAELDPAISDHYTASIDWGDGSTTVGTVIHVGGKGFTVQGGHTYAQVGTYTVTISIAHESYQTVVTSLATVTAAPVPPAPPAPPAPPVSAEPQLSVPVVPPPVGPVLMPGTEMPPVAPPWTNPLLGVSPTWLGPTESGQPYYSKVNPALILRTPTEIVARVGESINFHAEAFYSNDFPAPTAVFAIVPIAGESFPTDATIDPSGGVFTWYPSPESKPGRYRFLVRVSDGLRIEEQVVTLTLLEGAVAGAPREAVISADEPFTFSSQLAPAAAEAVYQLDGAPEGAWIDPASGVFRWTPSAAQQGTHTFKVHVSAGERSYEQAVRLIVLAATVAMAESARTPKEERRE